jgi:RNA polymerase sigma-70 factor (ECF subfamily)
VSEQLLEDVLPAAQAGQAWALRAVYEQLAPRVLAYLRTRGAAEPEDLTSEVFLTVFPKLPTVTGGAAGLRTFTFSVAHARLVDDFRRRSRREPTVVYDAATDRRTAGSSEDEALLNLQTEQVRQALSGLPDDQRDVLVMRVLGDLTVDQVAQVLGRSAGAVKQLQRRGLLALRRDLAANADEPGTEAPDGVTL